MPPVGAEALREELSRLHCARAQFCQDESDSMLHRVPGLREAPGKAAAVRLQDRAMTYAFLSASGTLTACAKAASKRVVQKSHISSFTFSTSRR